MHKSLECRLMALEQHALGDALPADILAVRVVDYRAVLDGTMPQTGPIRIQWVAYGSPEETDDVP